VSQQLLSLAEPVSQERLSATAARLNPLMQGKSAADLKAVPSRADALEQDILTIIASDMRHADERASGEIYVDGLTNVLAEPEFTDSDEARRTLKLFEERSTLQDLLARTMTDRGVGGVQVVIGGEGAWEELRQCSMVLSRYGVPGMATGTLGVLGPMRMAYARTIPTVRYMAGLLSDLVNESIGGGTELEN
jgi:heat-inducible transcriptional repressor